jgi:DNA-binding response OmpR family regulator
MEDARLCDVLVVEDDPVVCEEMAEFIRRTGLEVLTAEAGSEAIVVARSRPPRVLIVDYNLPDMDGSQLVSRLRAFLSTTSVIMMSGRIDGVSEKTLEALRITVFLNKPVPMPLLRKAVVRLAANYGEASAPPVQAGWLGSGWGGVRE